MLFSPVRRSMTDSAVRLRAGATCAALVAATVCAGIAAAGPASAAGTAPVAGSAVTQSVPEVTTSPASATSPVTSTEAADSGTSVQAPALPVALPQPQDALPAEPAEPAQSLPAADAAGDDQAATETVSGPATDSSPSAATDATAGTVAVRPVAHSAGAPRAAVSIAIASAPVVTTQPSEAWVDLGQTATFTAHASGSPTPTVQWQSRRWFEDPWTDIAGATSDSYQSPPASVDDVEPSFRAVFTNSAGSVATDAADLRQNDPPPAAGTPSVPRNVKARQTAPGQITITWAASASAGTSPITSYGAGYGTRRWGNGDDFSPTAFKAVFDDIDDGDYTAVVFAVNDSGISRRVYVPISVGDLPSAPRHLAATRSGSKVTVTWAAPASAGYSAVGGYDIVLTSSTGRVTRTVPAGVTSAVFKNLPAGTYRIVVTASNTVGSGAAARLTVTVPVAAPQAPTASARPPASAVPAAAVAPAAQLAHTGVSGSAQTGLALALLALGLGFTSAARRLRGAGSAA